MKRLCCLNEERRRKKNQVLGGKGQARAVPMLMPFYVFVVFGSGTGRAKLCGQRL